MDTDRRHLASDYFGQLARSQRAVDVQYKHQLVYNWIAEQPTKPRLPLPGFVHGPRCMAKPLPLVKDTSTFREFSKRGTDPLSQIHGRARQAKREQSKTRVRGRERNRGRGSWARMKIRVGGSWFVLAGLLLLERLPCFRNSEGP